MYYLIAPSAITVTAKPTTNPSTEGTDDQCGSVALFPVKNKCWKIFSNITKSEDLCDKNFGEIKDPEVSADRFTGAECGCNTKARGDGFDCYGGCSHEQRNEMGCEKQGKECNFDPKTNKPFCNCKFGSKKDEEGKCKPTLSNCQSCKHNCHMASKCVNTKSSQNQLYTCAPCDRALGFYGEGKSCSNIDECEMSTHMCDARATCVDKDPQYDNGKKYDCECQKGWTKDPNAGTKCKPCVDNDECKEKPDICGPNARCLNLPGDFRCTCLEGYEKDNDNHCKDIDECRLPGKCPQHSNCTNTPGSYKCTCIIGFKMVNGKCEADPDYFCKDCDTKSTECKPTAAKDAFTCECKKNHFRLDARSCSPNTYCDKADKNNCAPTDRATCTDLPDGSGFNCTCKEGYEGDGRVCDAINICDRKRPCTFISNTNCVADKKDPREKYTCECRKGYVRQVADQDNDKAPCFNVNSNVVNNCTLCDTKTEECMPVPGDKTGALKSCVCKKGFAKGMNGRCMDKNECNPPEEHNCDKACAVCINKDFRVDQMYFKCEVQRGWKGNGTLGTCEDDDECEKKPCEGQNRECHNTVGSYKCPCVPGFREIPGVKDCVDDNECDRGNFTCNDYSFCKNTVGSYECVCQNGFKEIGRDKMTGKPICTDVDECKEGLNATGTPACPMPNTVCRNQKGAYICDCKPGFRRNILKECVDINECTERLDNCDVLSTQCNNTQGSFTCDCKHGYEQMAESNTTCTNINECTSTKKPHKCNPNSSCKDLPGSYECKCDANYEPEPDSHPMRPFCKRIDVCQSMKNLNCMCICLSIDTAPFYKCKCQAGSINFNDTMCIAPGFCDTEKNPKPEFPCPEHSVCMNERCVCERNYDWINVEEPITVEKIKARKGCKPESWCEKVTCPPRAMCRDTGAGSGECYCPDGFIMDEALGECIDINECYNKTLTCPKNSQCKNLVGSFKCECDEGYTNTNTNKDTKLSTPVCEPIKYCALRLDNCTMYNNTVCREADPFYECDCKKGYQRNQTSRSCGQKICPPAPCSDIDECALKLHDCDKNARCINSPGSFKCACKEGFFGPGGKKCFDDDECDMGTDNCDRDTQDCKNLPGSFNCTCKAGFEYGSDGKCKDINECLSASLNDCSKDPKLKCVNTPGSYYCECNKGYVKALNNSCIDENECNASPCPAGKGDVCLNTDGDYNCTCLKGYRKSDECEGESKTCPCKDIPECREGIILPSGNPSKACGANTQCFEQEGSYECKCKDGYEGNPFAMNGGNCTKIDLCTKFPCDASTQRCILRNKAPTCICKEGFVPAGNGKCVKNPCLDNNGGCGKGAMCFPNSKTGLPKCNCPSGSMLDENKDCVDENPCKCKEGFSCRSDVCVDKELQMCYKAGAKARCICDNGYEFDEKEKKCKDKDECKEKPCPSLANCTNTPGSYTCDCPRGQKYYGKQCIVDPGCSMEGYCREDPNASCELITKDRQYCKCKEGFKGSGRPADPRCVQIDPCADKEAKEGKKPCNGANEYAESSTTCQCKCNLGYRRNTSEPFDCIDINECIESLCSCKKTFVCKNVPGSYECVCDKYYKLNADKSECIRDDKCDPNPCSNVTEHCDWRTGKCSCKDEFKLAPNGTCIDRNECEENTYKCMENSKCNNTYGGYECVCFDGYVRKGDECVDINECEKEVCGKVHKCENLPGSYRCKCAEGYLQYGPRDCLKNATDNCFKCHKKAHCLLGLTENIYNCTCNLGYEGDGMTNCTDIDECRLGIDNCHKLATCVNEQPLYSCHCNEPYIGDGRNVCDLPDMCTTKYNDCPKDADCHGLKEKDPSGSWVACSCRAKGFEFNNKTRQCEDINECTRCKDYANCPCPTESKCMNTEGSFTCECPAGYKYNQAKNTCDDIDECALGLYQEKCISGKGKCKNTPGNWECVCEPGYKNKADDNQVCEKEIFCGTKDACDKNTTTCVDLPVGYKCDCLGGLLHVPGNNKKCEDRNECKDGSHNCSLDGSELCTNTYQSFACNCTNGYTRDEKAKKCLPDNKCSSAEAEKANCGAYSFCVNLPGQDGKLAPKCICETGYYLAEKEKVCVVVPPCKNDFDCPSNSRCQVVQAQNGTGEIGTYKCICADGYEMKGHQCFPVDPCKTAKMCGEGVCVSKILPPFYECQCTPGTKQDNATAPCMPLTCEGNSICTPHAECKTRQNGGIYCQCKPGYAGLGIISSPCKQIDLCASATPCSRFARCFSEGDKYNCVCNEGYAGNGTWCSNVDECAEPKLNNCDENAICTDTQGGYKCTCKTGYTGVGTRGQCININECNDPASNQCEVISTNCKDTPGSYECPCKTGYERGNSSFACDEINECERNKTICGTLHKCHNIPASYECICAPGYELLTGSDKKTCVDTDECKLSPPPCNPNANCKNTEGSFECTCKDGYKGDGIKNCTIEDLCVPGKNKCDPKSTKCVMLSDKPAYVCECLEGFERQPGLVEQCADIDECADESTPYDRESVNCNSKPGTYELECKDLYIAKFISDNKKNISCVDKDECAIDPAYAETMKKVEAGQNKGTWKEWMVAPKDNTSGYAICYYNAINNLKFNNIQLDVPLSATLMPMCLNLQPKHISNQTTFDSRLKGFECTCPPPGVRNQLNILKTRFGFSCPNPSCPDCRTDLNYECVDNKCRCKAGYSERVVNNIAQCIQRECGNGESWPPKIMAGNITHLIRCEKDRWVPKDGYRITRDNVTHEVIDSVDINECVETPEICCANESKCTGPNCVKCFNREGGFDCYSDSVVCDVASVDKNTCKCQGLQCTKNTAWYAGCDGQPPKIEGLNNDKRVCSRIYDMSRGIYISFDNAQAMFDYAVQRKCDCCFLNKQPANFTDNPLFNYYGPCQDNYENVVCLDGEKFILTEAGPWCPMKAKRGDFPSVKIGTPLGQGVPDAEMCDPLPAPLLMFNDGNIIKTMKF